MNKNIPENWSSALQNDCVSLVKRNLGVNINKSDADVLSPNFHNVLPLIVKAMGRELEKKNEE